MAAHTESHRAARVRGSGSASGVRFQRHCYKVRRVSLLYCYKDSSLAAVADAPCIDGPLALARQALEDAVRAMADPFPVWSGGSARWIDPLYARLRAGMTGSAPVRHRTVHRSRLPCRVDVLALLLEIDGTVAGWTPRGKGDTGDRLHQLACRRWRPQDCQRIGFYAGELQRWVVTAEGLLTPVPKVDLHAPCPRCGARFAYRQEGDQHVRMRALRVSETGCRRQACQAYGPLERIHALARLLGCPALPS